MAILTIDQFATKCNMPRRALMVYVGRGTIVVDGEMIDTNHDKNVAFFNKREAKGLTVHKGVKPEKVSVPKVEQIPREETYKPPTLPIQPDSDAMDGILPLSESERLYKHRMAEKVKVDIEKVNLDISKKRGEVIPYELIIPLFLQHNQSLTSSFKNVAEAILTEYGLIKSFSTEEMAMLRGRMIDSINLGIKNAHASTSKNVANIVREFSEKRGAGERL